MLENNYFITFQCRDTYSVESFNHMMLTYVPKRIHFSTRTFKMRMDLAVLDWVRLPCTDKVFNRYFLQNENVHRAHTSQRRVADLRRPDRRTQMKVLVRKSFTFVDMLWATYVQTNSSNLQSVFVTYIYWLWLSPYRPLVEGDEEDEGQLVDDGALVAESDDDDDELIDDECKWWVLVSDIDVPKWYDNIILLCLGFKWGYKIPVSPIVTRVPSSHLLGITHQAHCYHPCMYYKVTCITHSGRALSGRL